MDENTKRPNAALINREWFESACKVLSYEEQGALLVNAVEYVLNGEIRARLSEKVAIVFEMVKPALDSDVTKYAERCARNASNARSQRQRVAASGSESQPVAANSTTTSTSTSTSTSTTTPSISSNEVEEREKWLVFGYFWSTGSKCIKEELLAFWSYYESLGWRNNKGAAIVSKIAAARMWRRQYETSTPPNGSDAWYKALNDCPVPDYNAWLCFAGAERTPDAVVVRLRCRASFWRSMTDVCPAIERRLQAMWKANAVIIECLGGE